MKWERHRLKHPGEFKATGRVQVLKDGTPFYVFDKPGGFTFTLPPGTYKVQGATWVRRMPERKGHTHVAGPRFPLPKRVRILWGTNPHKAVISLVDGIIVLDPSLRKLPQFVLTFILFHEVGHYFYEDEESCDRFAAEEMHKRGFTPSQIHLATSMTLKDHHRKSCNYHTAKTLDQ